MAGVIEQSLDHWIPPAKLLDHDYADDYNLQCITSLDEFKTILSTYRKPDGTFPLMGFDTETTGLNPEEDSIVGFSFAFNEIDAYYLPVEHQLLALGSEALDLIYEVMKRSELVLMYNARFDIRMMEWYKFENESQDFKKKFILEGHQLYSKYDMSKVKTRDIQVDVWAADTKFYMPKLKWAELQILGWRSTTFEETQGSAVNFAYLDPTEPLVYKYAATDALALVLIFNKLKWIRKEAGLSLEMHAQQKLIPLLRFEETPIKADITLLKQQSEYYHNYLNETEQRIYSIVGYPFNISSGPARAQAFKDKNIVLTAKTRSGKDATDAFAIDDLKDNYEKDSEQYILLDLCTEYLHIKKMLSTYIDKLLDQVTSDSPEFRIGLFRYAYRNTSTTSGRYSGGTS